MAQRSVKNICVGISLICLSIFCGLSAVYLWQVQPALAQRESIKIAKLEDPLSRVTRSAQLETPSPPPPEVPKEKKESAISVKKLVQEAESIYGKEASAVKEGSLWVDRASSKYVITLGAINGLTPGKRLSVYKGDMKLGEVSVETALDTISYVHPEESLDLSQTNYYRVVIE